MLTLTVEHLGLVGLSMLLAVAIGVPLGILLNRRPGPHAIWQKLALGATSIVQTVPSLALFGFLLPLPWLGARGERSAVWDEAESMCVLSIRPPRSGGACL